MIRVLRLACALGLAAMAGSLMADDRAPNTLTAAEAAAGWTLLWDGASTQGWRSVHGPWFPSHEWQIENGVLSVVPTEGLGEDIITVARYSDFELSVDFRITPGCNSGIKIFVDPERNRVLGSSIGLEYQILDDLRNPDAKMGRDGNRTLGALYDLYPPSRAKRPNPIGEWNTAVIISSGPRVEHWLNGSKILEYTRFSPEFRERVQASKFRAVPGFGELRDGHILLQDHGDAVSFRSIRIRVITAGAAKPSTPTIPQP